MFMGEKFFILYTNSSANTGNAEGKMVIEIYILVLVNMCTVQQV